MPTCMKIKPLYVTPELRGFEEELREIAWSVYEDWRNLRLSMTKYEETCTEDGCSVTAMTDKTARIGGRDVTIYVRLWRENNRMTLHAIEFRIVDGYAEFLVTIDLCREGE